MSDQGIVKVGFLGSSSANEFGPINGLATLLRNHLRLTRHPNCVVNKTTQNGTNLMSQVPTGYTLPAAIQPFVSINTSLNVTAALALSPDILILWQPTFNSNLYASHGLATTVTDFENVMTSDIIPACQAIRAACVAAGVGFLIIGGYPVTAAGKSIQGFTDAEITGRHFGDNLAASTFGNEYINGGWNRLALGTNYNDPTQEIAAAGTMDSGTEIHWTQATATDQFNTYLLPRFNVEYPHRPNPRLQRDARPRSLVS